MFHSKNRAKGRSLIDFPESYCIIDIETTGLSPEFDSIIEIACIKYERGKEIESFSSLIKPEFQYEDGTYIDDFIVELTGITNEMLSTAPDIISVLDNFKCFVGDSVLIGHNINFDINFLYDNLFEKFDIVFSNDFVDTMRLSRRLHPEERHHRLSDISNRYNIDYSTAHRALEDCIITEKCYQQLKKEILEKYSDVTTFCNLIKSSSGTKAADIVSHTDHYDTSHPLYGKVCVFTGTLEKMNRKDAMQLVADIGGINADSVTKKTNFLILANNNYCPLIKDGKSNKQKKAEKLKLEGNDIEVIPENVFYDLVETD